MRIVSGRWRGRIILAPTDRRVRPTADRVRESWMSILQYELPGAHVLDLFAGSGALGLEALSRGAARAEFVDLSRRSLLALRRNIAALDAGDSSVVHQGDAVRFVERLAAGAFDVAFADPPYEMGLAGRIAARWHTVPFATVLAVEHSIREPLSGAGDLRRYGDTAISIFRGAVRREPHARPDPAT
ncbi:MAG TPA: 16S rRNA (guanine(966)-N(2))-methyltransferase RsmD [Gemmatimonadaceae bacterium]|jgi:16S rRNA (guanine966-N2)-methyltransferase|nr:16S rRNA (guanine(966)-N(2))-methyltransferase RsmD [Gemmatimonadaceae bacterium]